MKLSDIKPRLVRLLEPTRGETDEERRQRRYSYTVKYREQNREQRNANDRAWRADVKRRMG